MKIITKLYWASLDKTYINVTANENVNGAVSVNVNKNVYLNVNVSVTS